MASTPSNANLRTEVWTSQVREKLIHGDEFLNSLQDFTAYVNESVVTVPLQGTLPTVEVNLDLTDPDTNIGREKLVELDSQHTLDTYGTKETIVRNIDRAEISYDVLQLHTDSHAQAFQEAFARDGLYALSVGAERALNKTYTPKTGNLGTFDTVFKTSGANSTVGGATPIKKLAFVDIIKMATRFDKLLLPKADRYMILNAEMRADLQEENIPLYNQLTTEGSLYGFNIMYHELLPTYGAPTSGGSAGDIIAKAKGTAISEGAGTGRVVPGAIFFQKNYTFKALGNVDMFSRVNDSQIRGTGINFEVRFVVDKVNSTSTTVAEGGHAMGTDFGFGTIVRG